MRKFTRRIFWRLLQRLAPLELVVALRYREQAHKRVKGAFPVKNIVVTTHPSPGKILVLAPHPDDEVIGPGGTIIMHLNNGDHVTILYLTDGQAGEPGLSDSRHQEALNLGTAYGLNQIFWELPDTKLRSTPQAIDKMVDFLAEFQPNIIFVPSFFERHYDHLATNDLLAHSLREMGNASITILGYEVWDNIPRPNYMVDISDTFEIKTKMMQHYVIPMGSTDFVTLCRHRNALHYSLYLSSGRRNPEGYAEAYYRLDADDFLNLYDTYAKLLKANHSPMVTAVEIIK